MVVHKGSCLCGTVSFTVTGDLSPPDACHCNMCRKQSGHYFASTDIAKSLLTIIGEEDVIWFKSSEKVRRGFCRQCGSTLFWDPVFRDWIAIAMGAFDTSTATRLAKHIHTASKGDYYDLTDELPQHLE